MSDFKGRHFSGQVILWTVLWYCKYGISYLELAVGLLQKTPRSKLWLLHLPLLVENDLNIEQTIHKGRSLPCLSFGSSLLNQKSN